MHTDRTEGIETVSDPEPGVPSPQLPEGFAARATNTHRNRLPSRRLCGQRQLVVRPGQWPAVIRYRCGRMDCPSCLEARNFVLAGRLEEAMITYCGMFNDADWDTLRERIERAKATAIRLPQIGLPFLTVPYLSSSCN